jgi:hypothetical protein
MRHHPEPWFTAALLLFVGAMMVVDPASLLRISEHMSTSFRNFEMRTRGLPLERFWKREWPNLKRMPVSRRGVVGIRIAGCLIIGVGLAMIAVS